jgi:hypothetical protein
MARKKPIMSPIGIVLLLGIIAAGIGGVVFFAIRTNTGGLALRRAIPVGGGFVVRDHFGFWWPIQGTGQLGERVDVLPRNAIPLAWTDRLLWLSNQATRSIELRSLPGLQPAADVGAAVSRHSILNRGYTVAHLRADGALVLRGGDRNLYAVTPSGQVEPVADPAGLRPVPSPDITPTQVRRVLAVGQLPAVPDLPALSPLRLVSPGYVMSWAQGAPVRLDGPPSVLVMSFDIDGPFANARLHRVSSSGEILWTANAEELVAQDRFARAEHQLLHVGASARAVTVLAQAWAVSATYDVRNEASEVRLVTLDPATGAIRSRVEVRR